MVDFLTESFPQGASVAWHKHKFFQKKQEENRGGINHVFTREIQKKFFFNNSHQVYIKHSQNNHLQYNDQIIHTFFLKNSLKFMLPKMGHNRIFRVFIIVIS